jgi:hypothetical protein
MALVRTDISEERIACIIRVTRIREVGIESTASSKLATLRRDINYMRKESIRMGYMGDGATSLHTHRSENLRSYEHFYQAWAQASPSENCCVAISLISSRQLPAHCLN